MNPKTFSMYYAPQTPAEDPLPAAVAREVKRPEMMGRTLSPGSYLGPRSWGEKLPCEQFGKNWTGLVQWEPGDSTPFARRMKVSETRAIHLADLLAIRPYALKRMSSWSLRSVR